MPQVPNADRRACLILITNFAGPLTDWVKRTKKHRLVTDSFANCNWHAHHFRVHSYHLGFSCWTSIQFLEFFMLYDTTVTIALSEPPLVESLYPHRVAQYLIIACLTVSSAPGLQFFPDIIVLQLCLWDWLIAISDEVQMICHGGRYHQYLLDMVYLVVR